MGIEVDTGQSFFDKPTFCAVAVFGLTLYNCRIVFSQRLAGHQNQDFLNESVQQLASISMGPGAVSRVSPAISANMHPDVINSARNHEVFMRATRCALYSAFASKENPEKEEENKNKELSQSILGFICSFSLRTFVFLMLMMAITWYSNLLGMALI
ncbi:hypothetical protein ACLKA7_008669 [Drosophila subpalustris]